MRLDQTGKGESSGAAREESDALTLKRDLERSNAVLSQNFGVEQFVIIGLCSGADDGIQGACLLNQVAGLVMFDGWAPRNFRYYLARYGPNLRPKKLLAKS